MSHRGLALAALLFLACRPDPGPSQYDQQEPFPTDDGGDELPGPNPFQPGQRRLSIGAFYESGFSDVVPIDNMTSNLYVYSDTLTLLPDTDHIEGKVSTRVTHAGLTWWGFGVHWMTPRDLTTWTHLRVSLKSHDATFAAVDIGMNGAVDGNPSFVHAADYGWANDDQWHDLDIPLAAFGLPLGQIGAPFILSGGAGTGGDQLRVDDLYFTAD